MPRGKEIDVPNTVKEKPLTEAYFLGLVEKYHVNLSLFKSDNVQDNVKAFYFAFSRVNYSQFIAGDRQTEELKGELFIEIFRLALWLTVNYSSAYNNWKKKVLEDVRGFSSEEERANPKRVQKLYLKITIFDLPFYLLDHKLYTAVEKYVQFPSSVAINEYMRYLSL